MERHPDRETLRRFADGDLSPEAIRGVERHLEVCRDCQSQADEEFDLPLLAALDAGYDSAFDRAVLGAAEQLAGLWGEARSAESLFAELLREPPPARHRRVRDEDRFHSVRLCQLLQARSQALWFSDVPGSVEAAELAVEVAERLDPKRYGSVLVEDTLTFSWALLGNAYRISADFWRAEKSLRHAWNHHLLGSGDVYTEAELLKFTSSLRHLQGQLDDAVHYADRAIAIYREGQDRHLEGLALVKKGLILGSQTRYQDAVVAIRSGLGLIDQNQDPRLYLAARHNLSGFLPKIGALEEAWNLLKESRPLYAEEDVINLARMRWLEGGFNAAYGRTGEAAATLQKARDFFLDQRLGFEVVRISLDLSDLYARNGQPRKVRESLDEVIPLGEALGLRQEVLMARLLYEQAR